MATTGTLTLEVTNFVPWVTGSQAAENCCTAVGTLETSNSSKISITYPVPSDQTKFTINIGKHGTSTALEFQITGSITGYAKFTPVGIAFLPDGKCSSDPTGMLEFPSSTVETDSNGVRVLTLDVAKNFNEKISWDFYVVIQAYPSESDGSYDIGVIDPKIRGTTD